MDMQGNPSLKTIKDEFLKHSEEEMKFKDRCSRLLVNLQRFEAKSSELAARTHTAHKMKEQYDKYLMQQNPLLWARIQRTIAVVPSFNDLPITSVDSFKFYNGRDHDCQGGTINLPVCEPDDESDVSSEAAWPHSPSPIRPIHVEPLDQELATSVTPAAKEDNKSGARNPELAQNEHALNPALVEEVSGSAISDTGRAPEGKIEKSNLNKEVTSPGKEKPNPAELSGEARQINSDVASPAKSSSVSAEQPASRHDTYREAMDPLENKTTDFTADDATRDGETLEQITNAFAIGLKFDVQESIAQSFLQENVRSDPEPLPAKANEETVAESRKSLEPEKPGPVIDETKTSPKPFSLESDSEETDQAISGPAQTSARGDDSDSFWE